jgi:hypothetical protein
MKAEKEFSFRQEGDTSPEDEKNVEYLLTNSLRPELNYICANPIRACIIHLLVKNKDLNHTIRVEELAQKLGRRHSVIIYHLERLKDWKIVKVIKAVQYGDDGQKRSIWGLNLDYPNLVREVYSRIVKVFFTEKELDSMSSVNRNVREKEKVKASKQ